MDTVRVLSLGAGIQSSTLALMYETGELENPPDFAVFADTQREPKEVYDYFKYLQSIIKSYPIHLATKGDLGEVPHKIPFFIKNDKGQCGMGMRQCTSDYKIRVVDQKIRQVLGYQPRKWMKHHIEMIIGISTDEIQRTREAQEKWKSNHYPLIEAEMSRQDCISWYKKGEYKTPPRSACYFCPYKSDREWAQMKTGNLSGWEDAVEYDKWLRSDEARASHNMKNEQFLHRSLQPLDEVDFVKDEEELNQLEIQFGFNNECEGMCGL